MFCVQRIKFSIKAFFIEANENNLSHTLFTTQFYCKQTVLEVNVFLSSSELAILIDISKTWTSDFTLHLLQCGAISFKDIII